MLDALELPGLRLTGRARRGFKSYKPRFSSSLILLYTEYFVAEGTATLVSRFPYLFISFQLYLGGIQKESPTNIYN